MAVDSTDAADLQEDRQLEDSPDEAAHAPVTARLLEVHTALPGIVKSFDPATQTAVVQPALQRIIADVGPVTLPELLDVPVQFPRGGGFVMTFPVAAGDECLLHFSERAIDFWWDRGGIQLPSDWRTHDLSDAFATVGVASRPNFIKNFNASATELRTLDGQTMVRLENGMVSAGNMAALAAAVRADIMNQILALISSHVHVVTGTSPPGGGPIAASTAPAATLSTLPDPSAQNVKVS